MPKHLKNSVIYDFKNMVILFCNFFKLKKNNIHRTNPHFHPLYALMLSSNIILAGGGSEESKKIATKTKDQAVSTHNNSTNRSTYYLRQRVPKSQSKLLKIDTTQHLTETAKITKKKSTNSKKSEKVNFVDLPLSIKNRSYAITESGDVQTTAPENAHTTKLEHAHTTESENTLTTEPGHAHTTKPEHAHTTESENTLTTEPGHAHTTKPEHAHTTESENTLTTEPGHAHTTKPEHAHTTESENTLTTEPGHAHTTKPEHAHTTESENTLTKEPRHAHTTKPEHAHTTESENTLTTEPGHAHTTKPEHAHTTESENTLTTEPGHAYTTELENAQAPQKHWTLDMPFQRTHISTLSQLLLATPHYCNLWKPVGTMLNLSYLQLHEIDKKFNDKNIDTKNKKCFKKMLYFWLENEMTLTATPQCTPQSLIFSLAVIITGSEVHQYKTIVEKLVKKLLPNIDTDTATAAIEQYKEDKLRKADTSIASSTDNKLNIYHFSSLYILCMLDKKIIDITPHPIYEFDAKYYNFLDYLYDVFNVTIKERKKIANHLNHERDDIQLFEILAAWLKKGNATVSRFYEIASSLLKYRAPPPLEREEDDNSLEIIHLRCSELCDGQHV